MFRFVKWSKIIKETKKKKKEPKTRNEKEN